jgi:hypothetical protein
MRLLAAGLLVTLLGCSEAVVHPPPADVAQQSQDLFGPSVMRLHPIFTQIKNFSGEGKPDGIEAVLEFDDRFGDPTKAAGSVIFELFAFRTGVEDPRGRRLVEPWATSLDDASQQQAHWRREIGAYSFLLADDKISDDRTYVLTATFEPLSGRRLFANMILQGRHATTQPLERKKVEAPTLNVGG